mmetsp:Transcript_22068/g.41588  ORF Transcript_22068/g.41588 Transcript_22068/m.41588 type:complete len:99 (+) Transcript_22068:92-388(+)
MELTRSAKTENKPELAERSEELPSDGKTKLQAAELVEAEAPSLEDAEPPPPPPPPIGTWAQAFNGVVAGQRRRRGTGAPLETVLGTIRCAVFGCNCDE